MTQPPDELGLIVLGYIMIAVAVAATLWRGTHRDG
jgi:hypothetical protein